MTENRLTDNKIIKALKVCHITCGCTECPYEKAPDDCVETMKRDALDLINRQKEQIEALIAGQETLQKSLAEKIAEIERLNAYISRCESGEEYWVKCLLERPAEAVKEFAEKIKLEFYYEFEELIPSIMADKIDNLVKEMVGEK